MWDWLCQSYMRNTHTFAHLAAMEKLTKMRENRQTYENNEGKNKMGMFETVEKGNAGIEQRSMKTRKMRKFMR